MHRCAHCGHYGRRSTHCSPRKKKPRRKAAQPRQRADKNDRKRGTLPTECFVPVGTPRYSHKPFDDTRCIRLLVLLPGSKWEPVRCDLLVRSLDKAQYEAISYAWGPEEERGDILCHGQRLKVPWNLEHGLRKFRRLRKKRVLWADSVCINQDDTAERGHQVQNMSRVYEKARKVLVWLGTEPWDSNSSALFQFIRELGPLPPPDDRSAGYVDYQVKKHGGKHWPTFGNLNHTGWFRRLWVIQEIGLASSATVHYGSGSLDWEVLEAFSYYIFDHEKSFEVGDNLRVAGGVLSLQASNFRFPGLSIPLALFGGQLKDCSDPRDRVYAFLGHSACLDTISSPNSALFLPIDYSISYKDLYTAVAIRALQAENFSSLEIIDFAQHNSISIYDYEVPSWVPRWDISSMQTPPIVFIPTESGYMTHGHTTVEASLNGNCLSVAGFTFDSVIWVSEALNFLAPSGSSKAFCLNPHPFIQTWNYIRKTAIANPRNMLIAMCLTRFVDALMDKRQQRRLVTGGIAYACEMGLDVSGLEDLIDFQSLPYFRDIVHCVNRRYLVTSRGWIGLSLGVTLPGDDVCILFGAPTPFVVRQLPTAGEALYRLCGPCIISGIMEGEAIKMWEGGAFDKTTFNLI